MCPDNKPEKEYVVEYNCCVFQLAFQWTTFVDNICKKRKNEQKN